MSCVRLRVAIGALAIGLVITATGSVAQSLGGVSAGGPGCPKEGARAVLSDSGTRLRVSFDSFQAASAGARTGDLSRASCNLAIPMRVPPGKRFTIVAGQYHGSNALPGGARSVLRVEHFFPGRTGPVVEQTFLGPLRRGFVLDAPLSPVWSRCGGDAILRINASLRVTGGTQPTRIALKPRRDGAAAIYRLNGPTADTGRPSLPRWVPYRRLPPDGNEFSDGRCDECRKVNSARMLLSIKPDSAPPFTGVHSNARIDTGVLPV